MQITPVHILWNGHAGSAAANQAVLEEFQRNPDITVHHPTTSNQSRILAETLSNDGAKTIVAAGGDGSINSVVQGLMAAGAKSQLGVLPLGTGNDFCRTLAVPLDVPQAAALIHSGSTRRVDVACAVTPDEKVYFANMATGGNTGRFTQKLTDEMKQFWGPLVYLRGVLDVLADLVPFQVTVKFDDESPQRYTALNIFAANGRTSGTGLQVAPDASLEDGLLDVVIVLDCEPVEIAGLATDFALGDYRENENIIYRRAARISIDSDPPMAFSADGNLLSESAVEFHIQPSALEVIVGPDYVPSPETSPLS